MAEENNTGQSIHDMLGSLIRPLVITGGRVIDPSRKLDKVSDLLIIGGTIAQLGEEAPPERDYDVLNAEGLIVCPGFIDLHCHLRQPGFEDKETIATGTRAAARGGFTTVCCMPNTNPPLDDEATVTYVRAIAAREGAVRVFPIGCVTRGRQGKELVDMSELEIAGVVGYSDDGDPVADPELLRQALEYSHAFRLPIIDHCEDKALTRGGQVNEGVVSLELGLRGMPAAAETNIIRRDIELARQTGGRLHIAHVSTEDAVYLIHEAKSRRIPVTAEVTPHHLTLTEEAALGPNANAKVNPPLRTQRDVKALLQALKEGVIDAIATDHAPHTAADKSGAFTEAAFGISGLETAFARLMGLVHAEELGLQTLIARLTFEPAAVLGYEKLGTLQAGAPADIAVFDPNKEWTVDSGRFASKGKNTPFDGLPLTGKVMATIYNGNAVYKDDSIKIETRKHHG